MASAQAIAPRRSRWMETLGGQVLAFAGALTFAALVGALIILAYGESPLQIYRTVWLFSTSRPQDFARVLENATPLIFSGLSVAIAFKAGMFNIGTEGQYIVGMMTAAATALGLDFLPAPLLLPLVMLAAVAGGVIWAAIPAVLKVKTGAHEVVTTIMMNGIAVSLVAWAILHPLRSSERQLVDLRTGFFTNKALVPDIAGSLGMEDVIPPSVHLTWLFPIALLACAAMWFLLFRTRLGFETRAVGSSPGAAEAGGVNVGATQVKIFLLSGALSGFVGLNHLLGDKGYLGSNYEAGLGFAGIAVAFLGRNHPVGVALAAVLIGMLLQGQDGVAATSDLPMETLVILQGVLILSVVVAYELVSRSLIKRRQREARVTESA